MTVQPPADSRQAIAVIGHGKSGTRYLARYLQACGLDVRHEKWGADGCSAWELATLSLPGGPHRLHLRRHPLDPSRLRILHVVRDPLATLASWQLCRPQSSQFMARCLYGPLWQQRYRCDLSSPRARLRTSMRHWIDWQQLCERIADLRIQVETCGTATTHRRILGLLSLPGDTPRPRLSSRINTWRNRDGYRSLTVDDLRDADDTLTDQVLAVAARYGYDQ